MRHATTKVLCDNVKTLRSIMELCKGQQRVEKVTQEMEDDVPLASYKTEYFIGRVIHETQFSNFISISFWDIKSRARLLRFTMNLENDQYEDDMYVLHYPYLGHFNFVDNDTPHSEKSFRIRMTEWGDTTMPNIRVPQELTEEAYFQFSTVTDLPPYEEIFALHDMVGELSVLERDIGYIFHKSFGEKLTHVTEFGIFMKELLKQLEDRNEIS